MALMPSEIETGIVTSTWSEYNLAFKKRAKRSPGIETSSARVIWK
jgi:hypothetical protein